MYHLLEASKTVKFMQQKADQGLPGLREFGEMGSCQSMGIKFQSYKRKTF